VGLFEGGDNFERSRGGAAKTWANVKGGGGAGSPSWGRGVEQEKKLPKKPLFTDETRNRGHHDKKTSTPVRNGGRPARGTVFRGKKKKKKNSKRPEKKKDRTKNVKKGDEREGNLKWWGEKGVKESRGISWRGRTKGREDWKKKKNRHGAKDKRDQPQKP